MSLINDALKRANKSLAEKTGDSPPSLHIQPLDTAPAHPNWSIILLPAILILVLASAGWFFWKFYAARQTMVLAATPGPAVNHLPQFAPPTNKMSKPNAEPVAPAISRLPISAPGPAPQPTHSVASNVAVAIRQATNLAASDTPLAAGPPELKLQGIYFRRINPSVMINGRHLYKGNAIDGARVIEIERQRVTVEFNGTRQTLLLQ